MRATNPSIINWIEIALVAALAGRFAEQLFGSPTTGGVLVFWVLVGGLAALLMKPSTEPNNIPTPCTIQPVAHYATYTGIVVITLISITIA